MQIGFFISNRKTIWIRYRWFGMLRYLACIIILYYLIAYNIRQVKTHHEFHTPTILNRPQGFYNASDTAQSSDFDYCAYDLTEASLTTWPCKEVGNYNVFTPLRAQTFQMRSATVTRRIWRRKDGTLFVPPYLMNWYYTLGFENYT
eukprot:UN30611